MDGSDDYFDDIVLDDHTLAVLESEEQKYLSQAPPPSKRQKTNNGWKPVAQQSRAKAIPVDDHEDLPEISVHGDGSYILRGSNSVGPSGAQVAVSVPQPRVAPVFSASGPVNTRLEPHFRPANIGTIAPRPSQAPRPRSPDPIATEDTQINSLRKQIEELQRENQTYRTEARNATGAKLAKQGEVTILRKSMEKVAQEHAEQVAKLRQAKEESEAKQIALQKEMNAYNERLKSQLIFKQQELESSSRKPPVSVRSKRIAKEFPSTPLSTQMRGLSRTEFSEQTPLRFRAAQGSPLAPQPRKTPEKAKKSVKLPGFRNSFIDATPVRALPSRPQVEDIPPFVVHEREMSPIPFPSHLNEVTMNESKEFTDDLVELEPTTSANATEEFLGVNLFNWNAELTRVVLTHSFSSNASPTLQTLSGITVPPEFTQAYSSAVKRVLELVASTSQPKDYEASLLGLCRYLTLMLKILMDANAKEALTSLLNMLSILSCSLPTFGSSLLALSLENDDGLDILEILRSLICEHLIPIKHADDGPIFGNETLGLLEALCWNAKDDLLPRFRTVCRTDILMILLDPSQPPWLVSRTARLLVLLATYPKLSHDIMNTEAALSSLGTKEKDAVKLPHIDRLCSCLIDGSRRDSEAIDMKCHILTFFGILSVSHSDVHAALVGCQALIPSLVVFSAQMTTLTWEGCDVSPPAGISGTIRILNQTLFLLHHLVFGLEPNLNLRHRLHYAPSRAFNGITHMFIVTFGRLSCADPPEWISSTLKMELESMSEMAQDLLDLVVDGPEGDSIWAAYQADSGDADNNIDADEDMEAELLG